MRRGGIGVAVFGLTSLIMLGGCQAQRGGPDVAQAGAWLVRSAIPVSSGGRGWRSVIQAPHLQTDRDVGAAGIAYGLLAVADVTSNERERASYITAARQAADFLVGAQQGEPGRWPDFRDPRETSPMAYTSFDDGAAGIADLLWLMWQRTSDPRYRSAARAGMDWLVEQATGADGEDCPAVCRWSWNDIGEPSYPNGMGEGQAGIVYALSTFAQRTGDERYAAYARGGAAYLLSRLERDGGMPESDTEGQRDTGFVHGAAGTAFSFLQMYLTTGDDHWLHAARRTLEFLDRTATPDGGGLSWPVMVDRDRNETNPNRATGMEEGAAGIGWVYLQAYAVTREEHYLKQARAAGVWLIRVVRRERGGASWAEYEGSDRVHSGVNSGVAGIGWFLYDLSLATGDGSFLHAAESARNWLGATAIREQEGLFWHATRRGSTWTLPGEPSWHWGSAGIVGFLARMQGWNVDSPGMQPGLVPGQPIRRSSGLNRARI